MTQEADTRSLALSTDPHQRPAFWKRVIAGLLMLTINVSAFAQAVSPVLGAGGRPYSGYTKNGTLVQGGQVVGNPHQSLHDLQNPALWTTAAVAFSNTTDPSFTQAILGDIESAIAVTPEAGGLALSRLYLTPTNPYADANAGAAGCDAATTCNQAVYNQILLDAAASGYVATASGTHLGKTHDSSSAEIFNRGFNLYQEKPVFLAAQDPLGGATAFFALQGAQAKTHLAHLQTQNVSLLGGTIFFSQQTIKGPGNGSTSHWDGSINDPGAAFDAALGSAPSVNASGGSGGFVVGYIQPDGQAHEFNLQRDSHFQDFQRQQGYGEWGGYGNTDSALGQNLRTAGLQNQKGQQAAAGIDFGYFQEDRSLFLQGLDLYKFGNRGDNGLLQQLQNGQIGPGHPDYERARALAEERFKLAYASQVEYNTKAHFTAEAAKYQADQLDLAAYDNGKLFKSGLNLYDKRGDPEQERLLKLLENGELKPDHPRYAEIRGLAEARYKVAYAKALEPPKKGSWLKTLAAVVIAAVVVYFTAGAASGWAAAGISGATATSATGAVVVAGTAGTAATVGGIAATAIGSAVGAYAGAVVSAGIQTGSLNKALKAGENSFKGGVAGIIVNTAAAAMGLTVGNVGGALGVSESVANAVVNTVTGAVSSTIVQGGDLGKNLLSGAVNNTLDVISANVADYIGANTAVGSFEKYASHALLGCGVGMAKSGSGDGCVPAATGAVIGHLSADSVKVALSDDKDPGLLANIFKAAPGKTLNDNVTFVSGLIGGSAAVLVGDKDQTQGNFGLGQATAENAVKNNYLKHDEAKKLQALKDQELKGQCTGNCKAEIQRLEAVDRQRNEQLAQCEGSSASACQQAFKEVRLAAAEYVRKDAGWNLPEMQVLQERSETLNLAQKTTDGKLQGAAQGYWDALKDAAIGLKDLGQTLYAAANGDKQAEEKIKQGAGAAADYVSEPENWPYLLGVMTPQEREQLAKAYETGNGSEIGRIMGQQFADLPVGGGPIGSIKKIDGIIDAAADSANLNRKIDTPSTGAERVQTPTNGVNKEALPAGFSNANEFASFGGNVHEGLKSAGYPDVEPILQGSAVTGKSFGTGAPFDVGRVSDFDVALASPSLLQRAQELGIGVRSGGTRTGPLSARDLEALGLTKFASDINAKAGREVNFMIYESSATAVQRAPSISLPGRKN